MTWAAATFSSASSSSVSRSFPAHCGGRSNGVTLLFAPDALQIRVPIDGPRQHPAALSRASLTGGRRRREGHDGDHKTDYAEISHVHVLHLLARVPFPTIPRR